MKPSRSARHLLRTGVGYRTEQAYGSGVRDVVPVLWHESSELGNEIIPEVLDALRLEPGKTDRESMKKISLVLRKKFGRRPTVIWLTTKTGTRYYGSRNPNEYSIPPNVKILSDLGREGQLFVTSRRKYERLMR